MATQVLLPLIASLMFLVGIWLAFVQIRNWWKTQTELYIKPPSRISRRSPIEVKADSIDKQNAANTGQTANNAA